MPRCQPLQSSSSTVTNVPTEDRSSFAQRDGILTSNLTQRQDLSILQKVENMVGLSIRYPWEGGGSFPLVIPVVSIGEGGLGLCTYFMLWPKNDGIHQMSRVVHGVSVCI